MLSSKQSPRPGLALSDVARVARAWAARAAVAGAASLLFEPATAAAAIFRVATATGVMQQPTSHYYHAVYGIHADAATDSQKWIVRAQYLERPEYRYAGFADKEFGWFTTLGTKINGPKDRGLYAFFGGGRMSGYTKAEPGTDLGAATARKRQFSLPGPLAALEYVVRWDRFDVAVSHAAFVGFVDNEQTEAYVAWPYNVFALHLGYAW